MQTDLKSPDHCKQYSLKASISYICPVVDYRFTNQFPVYLSQILLQLPVMFRSISERAPILRSSF